MKGREKNTLSGNSLSRGCVRRKRFAKRGMAYFLTFLMLMGSVQTVAYAEENAKEIAGHLDLGEEKPSLEKTEGEVKTEERTNRPEEAVTSETTVSSDTTGESEEGSSLEETSGKDKTALSSSEDGNEATESEDKKEDSSEQKSEEELSEEEKAKLSEEGKKEEKAEYLEASSFSAQAGDLTVTATFPDGTFYEGTFMKVEPVEEEEKIEEAKKELEKEFKKEDPDAESEVEVLESVDISFYREIDGEVKEVQPKKGKKVEISLQKTEKIKEALSGEEAEQEASVEEELKIVHLSEEHPTEILPVKEEGENLLFSAKHFSTFSIGRRSRRRRELSHQLSAFWKDIPDKNAGTARASTGHSYTDGSNGVTRDQKDLKIIPPEGSSNATNGTTMGIELILQGDKNTKYREGTVHLYVPARIFKGWTDGHSDNPSDPDYWGNNKINVSPNRENWVYKERPGIIHGIAKAPNTNSQSRFNYEIVKKDVNGKAEPYLHLKNYTELMGGVSLKVDFAYNMTPSMLKVKDEVVDGKPKGVYNFQFPITLKIGDGESAEEKARQELSVHVETEVKETKVSLKPGTADVNGGMFYNWDPAWGDLSHWNPDWGAKPSGDPKDYFYAVWYVRVDRARGSSQPFTYKFALDPHKTDGGELVGAKNIPMDYRKDYYIYNEDGGTNIETFAQGGYSNIAKYMTAEPDPTKADRYLVNPVGKEQIGISKDPSLYRLPDNEPYLSEQNYSFTGKYNSRLYALLFRYPYQRMKDERDHNPTNFDKDGFNLTNGLKFTEKWADGHERTFDVAPDSNLTVFPLPGGGGKFYLNKYGVDRRRNCLDIFGLQTIYKDGTAAPLRYSNRVKSFTVSADYTAKNENVKIDAGGTGYNTVNDNPAMKNGSGVTITDGQYYLLSSKIRYPSPLNEKRVEGDTTKEDLYGLPHDSGTRDDVYRGYYKLKKEDYFYSSIYLDSMTVYDVEKVDALGSQGLVKFNPKSSPRDRADNYPPVEVYLKKKDDVEFKYGEFRYNAARQLMFYPEAGYSAHATADDTKPFTATNQLDLKKVFGSGEDRIVGLKLVQNSPYYRTAFDASYTMEITPTPEMREKIEETMERTDDYNISFLAGPATAEIRQYDKTEAKQKVLSSQRIGDYWGQVGYALTPLQISSILSKVNQGYVDRPEGYPDSFPSSYPRTGGQSIDVHLEGVNAGSLPTSLQGPEYTKKYLVNKGTIYDLLPAGTSVILDSVEIGSWTGGWEISSSKKLDPSEFTVREEKNWKNSGQTMLIIDFTIPKVKQEWSSYHNRSGWKVNYTLWNSYENILDRGRTVKNTLGYVNKDENTVWNGNYISEERGKNPGVEKLKYYKDIKEEAEKENPRFTTSVIEKTMNYGPVTVVEAAFSNGVSTEIEPAYLSENVSYMGDPYTQRLVYQAQSTTRTTDMLLFDILGKKEDRNGDFNGVDISSMLMKKSYVKGLANNTDTLKPRVFYTTKEDPETVPKDLGKPMYDPGFWTDTNPNNPRNGSSDWKEWNYENESLNTVDKSKITAVAFDLRTTAGGKKFVLNQEGLLIANVKMTASTDKNKVEPEIKISSNTGYLYSTKFKGDDVPLSSAPDMQKAITTHRLVRPLIFDIPVRKIYDYLTADRPASIKEWFSFTLKRADGAEIQNKDGSPATTVLKNPDPDGGLAVFKDLRLLRPGEYKFTVTESTDKSNHPGVSSEDMGEKEITIKVKDVGHKQLTADLLYTEDKPLTFENLYRVNSLELPLKVKKNLAAAPGLKKPDIRNAFSFTLERVANTYYGSPPMPLAAGTEDSMTLTNPDSDGGEVNFGIITFDHPGVYEYTVTEGGFYPGVENDAKPVKKIKVSVRDFGSGKLFALVSGDGLEFTNTFYPLPSTGDVGLEKKISGTKPKEDSRFHFLMRPEKPEENQPMPVGSMPDSAMMELEGAGQGSFATMHFTKPGVFNYTVEEVNDGLVGYTYDSSVYKVSFNVKQSENNIYDLIVERKIYKEDTEVEEILFDNQYSSGNPGGGGGGGYRPKPIPVGPVTPGGPGEKIKDPNKPTVPDVPEEPTPTPGENVPPAPTIPERIREIEKRIGEILGEGRKRPLTEAEKKELKRLGEVLGALRKEQSRKVHTADASHMIWYAFASAISCLCLGLYYLLDRKKRRR